MPKPRALPLISAAALTAVLSGCNINTDDLETEADRIEVALAGSGLASEQIGVEDHVLFAAPLTREMLETAKRDLWVTDIVSTYTEGEEIVLLDFDPRAACFEIGLDFHSVPVLSETLSEYEAERLADAVFEADQNILIVGPNLDKPGAIWAVYVALKDEESIDLAIARGAAAGLQTRAMVAAARRAIEENQ